MGKLENLSKIRALMGQDMALHGADIAVLKSDMSDLRARPELQGTQEHLEAVRSWMLSQLNV